MSTTTGGLPAAQTRAAPTAVPDAVAPPPHHPRFPLLDGMRAMAVMCVVIVHAALMGGAFGPSLAGRLVAHLNIGVTIFFLISGFLLYRPMVAHRGGGASAPRARDDAKRRLLRIYPAYWAVLTFLVICPGLIGVVGGNWLPMYALAHTLPIYSGRRCSELVFSCGLAQTWSLVVEATFYVVLPLYAVALGRITERLSLRAWPLRHRTRARQPRSGRLFRRRTRRDARDLSAGGRGELLPDRASATAVQVSTV